MTALAHEAHCEIQARDAQRGPLVCVSPFDLRVRAGQLLNDAGDDCDALASLRRAAASNLAEAAHLLGKIERLARAKDFRDAS